MLELSFQYPNFQQKNGSAVIAEYNAARSTISKFSCFVMPSQERYSQYTKAVELLPTISAVKLRKQDSSDWSWGQCFIILASVCNARYAWHRLWDYTSAYYVSLYYVAAKLWCHIAINHFPRQAKHANGYVHKYNTRNTMVGVNSRIQWHMGLKGGVVSLR